MQTKPFVQEESLLPVNVYLHLYLSHYIVSSLISEL